MFFYAGNSLLADFHCLCVRQLTLRVVFVFYVQLVYAHDTSRIIQCLMKYGAQEHKNAVFEELKGILATTL